MRTISDLDAVANSAEALSDQTLMLLARWATRIVTMFGLDPKGDLNDPDCIGWSGLTTPAPAESYIYPASQLRDQIRTLARSGQIDYTAIAELADRVLASVATPVAESSNHTTRCCGNSTLM